MQKQLLQVCSVCGEDIVPSEGVGTGYAIDDAGEIVCYECCAIRDEDFMREHGRIALYLTINGTKREIVNWPGTLRIPVRYYKEGDHNMAGVRRDVWFDFEGYQWHGVQYGQNSEVCHCKRTSHKVKNPVAC